MTGCEVSCWNAGFELSAIVHEKASPEKRFWQIVLAGLRFQSCCRIDGDDRIVNLWSRHRAEVGSSKE